MKVLKLHECLDPTTLTSRVTQDSSALVIEGLKCVEENASNGKFEANLDVRGFKPEDIKFQLRGNELTVIGIQVTEGQGSHDYSCRILLPDDVDLCSMT